jgi:hypothetical protein
LRFLLCGIAFTVFPSVAVPQSCDMPPPVSRARIIEAMRGHGAYSLTSTTTSMLFGSQALLALVRQRQREAPGTTQLTIDQDDWFAAHLQTAGVTPAEMSESARAGYEYRQNVLVDYGPNVIEEVEAGPRPRTGLDVTIFSADPDAPAEFGYKDTLSVPRMDVFNKRVTRFKMLEYDSMLVFDEVSGISVRPLGFLSAVFAVLGKPALKQTRLAVSKDYWQVVRGRVGVLLGLSKTGTAAIEPGGRGHEDLPPDRPDLAMLARHLAQPLEVRYGPPSCQTRELMRRAASRECHRAMGGTGTCVGE